MEVQKVIAKVENTSVPEVKKVALAYSGGLDSSLTVELLRRRYGVSDIVPINVDVGQGADELSSPRKEPDLPIIYTDLNAADTIAGEGNKNHTNGTPVSILIPNLDRHFIHIKQYQDTNRTPRPGHASYASFMKYGPDDDAIGAGIFSGRYPGTSLSSLPSRTWAKYFIFLALGFAKSVRSRSIAPTACRRNFRLGLSASAIIGARNSFRRFLVLLMIRYFRDIFLTSLCFISQSLEKGHFTSTGRSFHYLDSKRVIACIKYLT